MELLLYLDPDNPLSFVEPGVLPADAPDSRPWLNYVGDLAMLARTGTVKGTFSNQNPSVTVQLINRARQASKLVGQPIRANAELWDPRASGVLYFEGLVQLLTYGSVLEIEIGS